MTALSSKEWRDKNREHVNEYRRKYYAEHKEEIKSYMRQYFKRDPGKRRKYKNPLTIRWNQLVRQLRVDAVPVSDMLWNRRFYEAFMCDAICHYCLGPLSKAGHNLDRVDNNKTHNCLNVVSCCYQCNWIKGAHFTYEQMMFLAPSLRALQNKSVMPRIEA